MITMQIADWTNIAVAIGTVIMAIITLFLAIAAFRQIKQNEEFRMKGFNAEKVTQVRILVSKFKGILVTLDRIESLPDTSHGNEHNLKSNFNMFLNDMYDRKEWDKDIAYIWRFLPGTLIDKLFTFLTDIVLKKDQLLRFFQDSDNPPAYFSRIDIRIIFMQLNIECLEIIMKLIREGGLNNENYIAGNIKYSDLFYCCNVQLEKIKIGANNLIAEDKTENASANKSAITSCLDWIEIIRKNLNLTAPVSIDDKKTDRCNFITKNVYNKNIQEIFGFTNVNSD